MIKELPRLDHYYLPIPFEEYIKVSSSREDSKLRYKAIKDSYGSFSGKTMLDFGCAEGYFMFKFIQDGGRYAVGIEINDPCRKFVNELADYKLESVFCTNEFPDESFDIGLYLDLYGHSSNLPTILQFYSQCETLYISCSGDGDERGTILKLELGSIYKDVLPIGAFFKNRMIYRCSK